MATKEKEKQEVNVSPEREKALKLAIEKIEKDFIYALIISIVILLICWAEGGDELLRRLYSYLVG